MLMPGTEKRQEMFEMKIALVIMLGMVIISAGCVPASQNITVPSNNTIIPSQNNTFTAQAMVSWAEHYGTLGDLVKAADLIVKGNVVGIARSYVDKRIPFTDFDVEVDPVLKGSANSTILVHQTGGIIDDPALVPGKTYFLFLWKGTTPARYYVLGGPQGRFEVLDGRVYSLSALYPDRIISDLGVAGTPLPDFIQQVRESLESK